MLLSILIGAAVLVAYLVVEKRINQRACLECGFTLSVDAIEEHCPRCDAPLGEIPGPRAGNKKRRRPPSGLDYR